MVKPYNGSKNDKKRPYCRELRRMLIEKSVDEQTECIYWKAS
jgi:hypothetical protein